MKNNKKQLRTGVSILILVFVFSAFSGELYAKKSKMDPESERFYQFARHLFTKHERKLFLNLKDKADRQRFISQFWDIRDPDPSTEENEFRFEMEDRFKYVEKYFREGPIKGWNTDRGRIYILMGAPTSMDTDFNVRGSIGNDFVTSVIRWYYAESNIFVMFIEKRNSNSYKLDLRSASLHFLDELERKKFFINPRDKRGELIPLKFDLKLETETKKDGKQALVIYLDTKNLYFKESGESDLKIKLKIDLMVYHGKLGFKKHRLIKDITIDKKEMLKNDARIQIPVFLELPKGKFKVDVSITDLFGNAVERRFFSLKNKKGKK